MTLKLSWESLKCQILLSLIHGNLGCTSYCAANLEIHDKSLFQSFLWIIFAQPRMKRSTRSGFYNFWMWLVLSLHMVAWKFCCRCQNCDTTNIPNIPTTKNISFSPSIGALSFTEYSLMWDVWLERRRRACLSLDLFLFRPHLSPRHIWDK